LGKLRLTLILASAFCVGGLSPGWAEPTPTSQPSGEIIWDNYGIPHIYGKTTEDVLYGYGYAQMEAHAETIIRKVATARGRLAEYFGPGTSNQNIVSDTQIRTFDIPRRSETWLAAGTDEQRRYLTIFCNGLNAYASQHGSTINSSLKQVLPIVPTDILDITQNTIHFSFLPEQSNVPALIADWQASKQISSNPSTRAARAGSNGWAIAPKKSANGHALLMGNPHLPWGVSQPVPNLDIYQWVEAQLVIGNPDRPHLNASGVGFTGSPFIGIGFTDDIGWTHTNNTMKNADLYEIAVDAQLQYQFDGKKIPLNVRQDTIKIAGGGTQTITILSSVHGPIVASRTTDGHALVLRVAGLDGTSIVSEYWGMIRAHDLAEFSQANATLQMPFFNVLFADRQGEIMYLFGGKQPIRNGGTFADYTGILDGSTSSTLWKATLPWKDLPKTINPDSGFVQNSNDPPWTSTFPRTINPSNYPAWISPVEMTLRPQQGATYLLSKHKLTLGDVLAGKESTKMFLAGRVLPDLIAAAKKSSDPVANAAASVLQKWDQTADQNSKGGPLFERWYEIYLSNPSTPRSPVFGSTYPAFKTEWSLDKALTTPVGLGETTLAVQSLSQAAQQLQGLYGAMDVDWGTVHQILLVTHDPNDPLDTQTPIPAAPPVPQSGATDVFGPLRVIDSFPKSATLRLGYGGDGYVQIVDFDPLKGASAMAVMTYGNQSRPGLANVQHIVDQLPIFEAKSLRPVLRKRSEVLANAVSTEKY
jgi:acyl-homoserine-lactone acylase